MASDIAICMFHGGLDAFTDQEVHVACHLRDRKVERTPLQFFNNPAKGEPVGECGLPNPGSGYRPGRKTATRRKKGMP